MKPAALHLVSGLRSTERPASCAAMAVNATSFGWRIDAGRFETIQEPQEVV